MKLKHLTPFAMVALLAACGGGATEPAADQAASSVGTDLTVGQSGVVDDESQRNVVQVAVSSPDHSTLVTAVKTAGLVDALSNAGPFTVFAPTNAAFDALPAGTVDGLLKPEKKDDLTDILQYHVAVGVYSPENLRDGQVLGMVNGDNVTFHVKDGQVMINDAKVVATVPAANGLVCVIDKVILPQ
ncbi:MAG TPA: fasciclin domain-containing protein [Flavobacteriales bacterium]|nr:fasciclin domain-containing protein [Flavobacteriales bacterium]